MAKSHKVRPAVIEDYADPNMVRSIVGIYRSADPESLFYGERWYVRAHAIACNIALEARMPVSQAAGVIAALSPAMSWSGATKKQHDNISLAWAMVGLAAPDDNRKFNQTTANLSKAAAIVRGADPECALRKNPQDENASLKTRNFFRLINDPSSDNVCVDRHAVDIAMGAIGVHPNGPPPSRYKAFARAYIAAARILGVPASQVQAVTWEAWRKAKLADAAANGEHIATSERRRKTLAKKATQSSLNRAPIAD